MFLSFCTSVDHQQGSDIYLVTPRADNGYECVDYLFIGVFCVCVYEHVYVDSLGNSPKTGRPPSNQQLFTSDSSRQTGPHTHTRARAHADMLVDTPSHAATHPLSLIRFD